jgi:hypothetical protein
MVSAGSIHIEMIARGEHGGERFLGRITTVLPGSGQVGLMPARWIELKKGEHEPKGFVTVSMSEIEEARPMTDHDRRMMAALTSRVEVENKRKRR